MYFKNYLYKTRLKGDANRDGGDILKGEKLIAVMVIAAGIATIILMLTILAYAVNLSCI
ncbi:MAG: hypothetical protein IJF09_08915 [Ruminiclostridium sp.]|nr:hypothetical protein [Ruminiclostridium sp.]